MICERMILRHFGKRSHWFECVFLYTPQLPMSITTGTDLMVVFRVEGYALYLDFGELHLSKHTTFVEPVVCYCFAVCAIGKDK